MPSRRIPSMAVPITCETCRAVYALDSPNDIDRSFKALDAAGWMHFARKGLGREHWAWKCPTCKPQGKSATTGLTTPGPLVSTRREG